MTDEQIEKGLGCCGNSGRWGCKGCPYDHTDANCFDGLMLDALSLIRRQKAEIERLSVENERLKAENERLTIENEDLLGKCGELGARIMILKAQLSTARADAVMDVIRRVLGEAITIKDHRGKLGSVVTAKDIERIAKEMTEGER